MKKANWLVYALLLSFFVVLSPRELWHDCDNHHEVHSKNEVHLEQKKCFACDFDLGFIDKHTVAVYIFSKSHFPKYTPLVESHFVINEFHSFSHRGPPNA